MSYGHVLHCHAASAHRGNYVKSTITLESVKRAGGSRIWNVDVCCFLVFRVGVLCSYDAEPVLNQCVVSLCSSAVLSLDRCSCVCSSARCSGGNHTESSTSVSSRHSTRVSSNLHTSMNAEVSSERGVSRCTCVGAYFAYSSNIKKASSGPIVHLESYMRA